MATFSIKSIALKWYYLTFAASITVYAEFSHLLMKQYGLGPKQIGMTSLFGMQHFLAPIVLFVGDKLRARKLVLCLVTIVSIIGNLLSILPLAVSLPTCFSEPSITNQSTDIIVTAQSMYKDNNYSSLHSSFGKFSEIISTKPIVPIHNVPPWSSLIFVLTISRISIPLVGGIIVSLASLATVTYLGKDRANYGAYYMWMHVGSTVLIVSSAAFAWAVRISICDIEGYGYFGSIILATAFILLSTLSLPSMTFKYEADHTINWTEVKSVLLNGHYVFMYLLNIYTGCCVSFQAYWEFWYLDGLEAGPLLMGGAALIRRPILAASIFTTCYMINRIGDLYTVCTSFLLFALSFFCLSFTRVYWYVLAIDIFQAMAYGFATSAFTVHFSKAGSKASSGVIMGLQQTCFFFGIDVGAAILGLLFHVIGTQKTMFVCAAMTGIVLGILLVYIKYSKQINEYQKLPDVSDDEDNGCHDDDDNDNTDYDEDDYDARDKHDQ